MPGVAERLELLLQTPRPRQNHRPGKSQKRQGRRFSRDPEKPIKRYYQLPGQRKINL